MGFMGLKGINDSDNAADFTADVIDNLADQLQQHLKHPSNELNTPGYIDVALFFKDVVIPAQTVCIYTDKLVQVAKQTVKVLQREKKGWDKDLRIDIEDMIKRLQTWIAKA